MALTTRIEVIKRNSAGEIVAIYDSSVAAAKAEGVTPGAVRKWFSGECRAKSGFTFEARKITDEEAEEKSQRRTKCWICKNAFGGCSWSREFKPVEGWTAERNDMKVHNRWDESYIVDDCPEFVPDGRE
jgi:hypothetical protein